MDKLMKLLTLFIFTPIIFYIFVGNDIKASSINWTSCNTTPIKVAVVVYDTHGLYVSEVIENLQEIQKQNQGKVEFDFFNSDRKQDVQNVIIDEILQNKEYKILLVELVDINKPEVVIDKAKEKNIPIILFSREPTNKHPLQAYDKTLFIGTNLNEAGTIEGQIIVNEWNKNRLSIDKNKDNVLQYVLLKGPKDNPEAIARANYSIQTIRNSGIKTQELVSQNSDWNNRELAKKLMESYLTLYRNQIEAIISTNDTMALGSLDALHSIGYNLDNKSKFIPIVGVDAVPEVRELIKKGYITGSVLQDAHGMAEALYLTAMNLFQGKNPLEGTNYKFDDSGIAIRIPYQKYLPDNTK